MVTNPASCEKAPAVGRLFGPLPESGNGEIESRSPLRQNRLCWFSITTG
jgi:hypothetical protein